MSLRPIAALLLATACALAGGPPPAVAAEAPQDAARRAADDDPLALPPVPEDAVERRVQRELDAAEKRIAEGLAELTARSGAAADEAPVRVDLAAAVELALARNPALRAVETQRGEVAAGVVEAKADAFPELTATSGYNVSRNPSLLNSPDFEDIIDQFPGGRFEPREQRIYSAAVEVSQPVFTFGKIGAAIELARLVVDVTDAQIGAARLDTALAAADAYYRVLAARESLAVGLAQQRVRREALEVVRARYEVGDATRLELLRSQSALAEVAPEIARLAGDLSVARSRLANALGLGPATPVLAEGGLPLDLPELGMEPGAAAGGLARAGTAGPGDDLHRPDDLPPVPTPGELWSTARSNRPEIADLELQQEVLAQRQVVTRAGGKPQVELNGYYGRQARLYEDLADPLFRDYSVTLGVRWELFDGGRRRGQVAQLESQRQQLGHRLRDLLSTIRLDLEQTLSAYRTARERWRAAETAAAAAREASRVARESYRQGVVLQTDWLDAQRQETEAEILAVEAYYDARREAARLARVVGSYPTEGWAEAAPGVEAPIPETPDLQDQTP